MTSSWQLKQRKLQKERWAVSNFGDPNNSLGGWEDHYIIPGGTRECHPDYTAHPIGNPYGFMICAKRKFPNGKGLDSGNTMCPMQVADMNGFHRYSADLYDPRKETQTQMYNPDDYYKRTTPHEEFFHTHDFLTREIHFNSTGIRPIHVGGDRKYLEYAMSYTNSPPSRKYDVTRLHQLYPIWKEEQSHLGRLSQAEIDKFDGVLPSSTMGTM